MNQPVPAPSEQIYISAIEKRMQDLLSEYAERCRQISPASVALIESIADLVTSGKRLRALLAWWGWQGAGGDADDPRIIEAGVSLELFQAAALIHDDVVDRSDIRRGRPSVHRRFEALHRESDWTQDSAHFGVASAVLTGDLALALSEEVFASAADATAFASSARTAFNTMRFEVMVGQYLDIKSEVDVHGIDPAEARSLARTVVEYKSANYSVVWPLAIGAVLAGADESTLDGLSRFSRPLGIAFQLQDDLLGVFGDPHLTGKPAGDDLREGKRTELIAHALDQLNGDDASRLTGSLGNPDLTDADVVEIQDLLESSGARAALSGEVRDLGEQALTALDALDTTDAVRQGLRHLTERILQRST